MKQCAVKPEVSDIFVSELGPFGCSAGWASKSLVSTVTAGLWVVASNASIGVCGVSSWVPL